MEIRRLIGWQSTNQELFSNEKQSSHAFSSLIERFLYFQSS